MARCPQCSWPLPEQAQFCSSCGTAIGPAVSDEANETAGTTAPEGLGSATTAEPLPIPENIAGVIAYITIFPAIAFLLLEPFKRNRFVRFHSFQHLLLWAAGVGVGLAASLAGAILQLIPFMRVLVFPLAGLMGLAWFFLWVLLVVKAYNHEMFKLPVLGDLAEQQAGA
jgi:uncharacterized membrane protein